MRPEERKSLRKFVTSIEPRSSSPMDSPQEETKEDVEDKDNSLED